MAELPDPSQVGDDPVGEEDDDGDEEFVVDELSESSSSEEDAEDEADPAPVVPEAPEDWRDNIEYLAAILASEDAGGLPLVEDELPDSTTDDEEEGEEGEDGEEQEEAGEEEEEAQGVEGGAQGMRPQGQQEQLPQTQQLAPLPPPRPPSTQLPYAITHHNHWPGNPQQPDAYAAHPVPDAGAAATAAADAAWLMQTLAPLDEHPATPPHHATYNTRARVDLRDVPIEALEQLLQDDWLEEGQGLTEDEVEYQKFLQSMLCGSEDLLPEDEDDEEFATPMDEQYTRSRLEDDEFSFLTDPDYTGGTVERSVGRSRGRQGSLRVPASQRKTRYLPERQARAAAVEVLRSAAAGGRQETTGGTPAAPSLTPEQLRTLHWQVHLHTQLLVQLHALTCRDPSARGQHLANSAWQKLQALEGARCSSTQASLSRGLAPLAPHVLGLDTAQMAARRSMVGSQSMLWRPPCVAEIRSVLDVAVLRQLPVYINLMQAFPVQKASIFEEPAVEAVEAVKGKDKKKRTRATDMRNPVVSMWHNVAEPVVKLAFPNLNPQLLYRDPHFTVPHSYWSRGEDELLALGIARHGKDWNAIATNYLPHKTGNQLLVRQKNVTQRRKGAHVIEHQILSVRGPLTDHEVELVLHGLALLVHVLPPLQWPLLTPGDNLRQLIATQQRPNHQLPQLLQRFEAAGSSADAHGGPPAAATDANQLAVMAVVAGGSGGDDAGGDSGSELGDGATESDRGGSSRWSNKRPRVGTGRERALYNALPPEASGVWRALTETYLSYRNPVNLYWNWAQYISEVSPERLTSLQRQFEVKRCAVELNQQAQQHLMSTGGTSELTQTLRALLNQPHLQPPQPPTTNPLTGQLPIRPEQLHHMLTSHLDHLKNQFSKDTLLYETSRDDYTKLTEQQRELDLQAAQAIMQAMGAWGSPTTLPPPHYTPATHPNTPQGGAGVGGGGLLGADGERDGEAQVRQTAVTTLIDLAMGQGQQTLPMDAIPTLFATPRRARAVVTATAAAEHREQLQQAAVRRRARGQSVPLAQEDVVQDGVLPAPGNTPPPAPGTRLQARRPASPLGGSDNLLAKLRDMVATTRTHPAVARLFGGDATSATSAGPAPHTDYPAPTVTAATTAGAGPSRQSLGAPAAPLKQQLGVSPILPVIGSNKLLTSLWKQVVQGREHPHSSVYARVVPVGGGGAAGPSQVSHADGSTAAAGQPPSCAEGAVVEILSDSASEGNDASEGRGDDRKEEATGGGGEDGQRNTAEGGEDAAVEEDEQALGLTLLAMTAAAAHNLLGRSPGKTRRNSSQRRAHELLHEVIDLVRGGGAEEPGGGRGRGGGRRGQRGGGHGRGGRGGAGGRGAGGRTGPDALALSLSPVADDTHSPGHTGGHGSRGQPTSAGEDGIAAPQIHVSHDAPPATHPARSASPVAHLPPSHKATTVPLTTTARQPAAPAAPAPAGPPMDYQAAVSVLAALAKVLPQEAVHPRRPAVCPAPQQPPAPKGPSSKASTSLLRPQSFTLKGMRDRLSSQRKKKKKSGGGGAGQGAAGGTSGRDREGEVTVGAGSGEEREEETDVSGGGEQALGGGREGALRGGKRGLRKSKRGRDEDGGGGGMTAGADAGEQGNPHGDGATKRLRGNSRQGGRCHRVEVVGLSPERAGSAAAGSTPTGTGGEDEPAAQGATATDSGAEQQVTTATDGGEDRPMATVTDQRGCQQLAGVGVSAGGGAAELGVGDGGAQFVLAPQLVSGAGWPAQIPGHVFQADVGMHEYVHDELPDSTDTESDQATVSEEEDGDAHQDASTGNHQVACLGHDGDSEGLGQNHDRGSGQERCRVR